MYYWQQRYLKSEPNAQELQEKGVVVANYWVDFEKEKYLSLVQVGTEYHLPNEAELQQWQKVFQEAENNDDPNFTIFTYSDVKIKRFNMLNNKITIITGDALVVSSPDTCQDCLIDI